MPRQNDGTELWKALTDLSAYRIAAAGGDTIVTPSISVGMSSVSVSATTGFASLDPIAIVGTGGVELNAIGGAPAIAMPLKYKTAFAHAAGARFVEMAVAALGHLEEGGIAVDPSMDQIAINSAIATGPVAYMIASGELKFGFGLLGFNGPNWQFWTGTPEAEIGTGVAADPYQVGIGVASMGTEGLMVLRASGFLQNGKNVFVDFCNARVSPTGGLKINRKEAAILPCQVSCTNIVVRIGV